LTQNDTDIHETMKANTALAVSLITGALLIPLTRLPQFLGGHLVPDGDECVLGIMAKHLMEGKALPVFYYGQTYGFSLLEAGTAAVFFRLFGVSAVPLKAAMLTLWAIGWLFLVLAVRRFTNVRTACITAVVLATCPAWGPWSMKAWGGYITAFLMSAVTLWLLGGLCRDTRRSTARCAVLGFCVGLVGLSQPIWLLGVAPFLVLLVVRRRRGLDLAVILPVAVCTALLVTRLGAREGPIYWSPPLFRHPDVLGALGLLPYRLWVHLSGAYLMEHRYAAGPMTNVSATLWFVLLVIGAGLQIHRWRRGLSFSVGHACAAAVVAVLVFTLPVNHVLFGFRYMLPLSGFVVILFSIELDRAWGTNAKRRALVWATIMLVVVCGTLSSVELGQVSFSGTFVHGKVSETRALEGLIRYLLDHGYHHVYSVDPMFHWVIMFTSGEQIAARWVSRTDRYPAYPLAVDRALFSGGGVAVVGLVHPAGRYSKDLNTFRKDLNKAGLSHLNPHVVNDLFYVLPNPSIRLIQELTFGPLRFSLNR